MRSMRPPQASAQAAKTLRRREAAFGDHRDFADLYETYLDAVYESRWLLIRQVANEIRLRGVGEVLDCAAGSGFPALNLAAIAKDYGIQVLHCTDGDPEMIRILRDRAHELGVELPPVLPARSTGKGRGRSPAKDPLVLAWADLREIQRDYDYVMCRGNSLAYADTWTGDDQVASEATIEDYLRQIALKVRPGGYLHIDAPWSVKLNRRKYRRQSSGNVSIWEEVETRSDARFWRVAFKRRRQGTLKFERYSSLLTIQHVAEALDRMGFKETEPFEMAGERPNFGVIIARRPTTSEVGSSRI